MRRKLLISATLCGAVLVAGAHAWAENATFFLQLSQTPRATLLDGYRAALALQGKPYADVSFQDAREALLEAGVIKARWPTEADVPLSRGRIACILVKVLGIKGGVTMRIFGPSPRYALRECAYLELMAGGAVNRYVTGRELVAIVMRADEFKKDSGAEDNAPDQDAQPEDD